MNIHREQKLLNICMMCFAGLSMAGFSAAAMAEDLDRERWDAIHESKTSPESEDLRIDKESLSWSGRQRDAKDKIDAKDKKDGVPEAGDPHNGSKSWLLPAPEAQMQRDAQLMPVMKGGIFVPSMSGGMSEPKFQVFDADDRIVRESYTGETAFVAPGDYTVVVGSPVTEDRLEFETHVVEGNTTLVPVEWSGLIVKVVNDRGTTTRGNYEIVSLPERGYIGLGSGALINEGERLATWLLWPGKYMIISAGEGYQARKNFITVELKPGELSRVTLVLDPDTGDVLGGGEIDEEKDDDFDRWWWAGVLVGGSVRFNRADNVVGKATGQVLDVSAFAELFFTLGLDSHFLYTRLNAEIGGTIKFEDRPFYTTVDELNVELLYMYRVVDWFGPFVRFSFDSNMAPSYQELLGQYTVNKRDTDKQTISTLTDQNDVQLSPSFSPITLNAGAGGRFDATVGSWFKLSSRLGAAYRHVFARDLYVVSDKNSDDKSITIDAVDSSHQIGLEAAVTLDLTPIQWFTLKLDASVLEPFTDWSNPIASMHLDAAFRLSSIASLSYTLRLTYDTSLIDEVQIDQYIQLRFSYKLY